jgi:uncharacterized damage-inducible protein DinB
MTAAPVLSAPEADVSPQSIVTLVRLLDDLASVVLQVSADVYTARPLPGVSGSIGAHVRHVLDHITAFAIARPHGSLTYDTRDRGTNVETDRGSALRAMMRLTVLLNGITDVLLDSPVTVVSQLSRDGRTEPARSTLRRELAFVVSHTIHHQALMAALLAVTGHGVPETFGLAPTTPKPSARS